VKGRKQKAISTALALPAKEMIRVCTYKTQKRSAEEKKLQVFAWVTVSLVVALA
jgi:hypothetical protein